VWTKYNSIDEIYANQGTIGVKLNADEHIHAKRINDNGKLFKVITHIQSNNW